jgi:hypothetical protein
MSFLSPVKTLACWSKLQESQADEDDDINDFLQLLLFPKATCDPFKENVSLVEEFAVTDANLAKLIVSL